MATGQTGRRRVSPRRLAAFLGQKEPQPVPSSAARATDAAIAAVATIAALVAAIVQFRTVNGPIGFIVRGAVHVVPVGQPVPLLGTMSPWALPLVALTTAPLAFRRTYPITAFFVILAAIVATSGSTHTTITFASVLFAAYCAVAYSPFRRLALVGVLFAAIVVTVAYPDTSPPVPARFGALLVLLPTVAVGVAIRNWRRRLGESAERLRRAQQDHEAETRRAVQEERARIASEMHDVVTHNVSVMVVQAGAARRVLDSAPGQAREALLAVEASGPPPGSPAPDLARGEPSGLGGRGLIGLRERIAVYHGELDAGPRPGGGWRLAARIPLEPAAVLDGRPEPDRPAPPEYQEASP